MILVILLFSSFSHTIFEDYQVSKMIDMNKWDVVQEVYENKVKNNPSDAQALFAAGVAAFKQEDLDRAQALFSRAAELDVSLQEKSLFNNGNIAMIHKKYQEALDAYESVLKINPENERARERAELARQLLQQPPEQDQKDQNKDDKKDKDQQQDKQDKDNSSSDSSEDDKDKQDKSDSPGEGADDKSQNRNQNDQQQEKNEKGQRDRHQNNKKSEQQPDKKERQGKQEETERQTSDHKKDQGVESQDKKSDHDKKNPQENSLNQSKDIDPKDQWKAQLFSALDKVEEGSHKDMMQVVYATQAPQDQTSNW